jgi:hypothetical protein
MENSGQNNNKINGLNQVQGSLHHGNCILYSHVKPSQNREQLAIETALFVVTL